MLSDERSQEPKPDHTERDRIRTDNGERPMAIKLAKANLEAFGPENLDAIIVNSAGCGSFMKHYEQLFDDDAIWREKARKGSPPGR